MSVSEHFQAEADRITGHVAPDDETTLPPAALAEDENEHDPPDTDDDPDEDEDDDPDEPDEIEGTASAAPLTEKEVEKRIGKLEREKERHTNRLREIMGADELAVFIPCEVCFETTPGFRLPAEAHEEGTPGRMVAMILDGDAAAPVQPAFLHTCASCNGLGNWITGSHADGANRIATCEQCGGRGFIDERVGTVVTPAAPAAVTEAPVAAPEPPPLAETDMMGRPLGHPNYGRYWIYLTPEQKQLDRDAGFAPPEP